MIDITGWLKDSGYISSSGAGKVDETAQVVEVGAGIIEGNAIVDVAAIEIDSNNELYKIKLQGSSKSNFADTYEDLAILELGAKEVLGGDKDSAIGRYCLPFRNERNGIIYPYLRSYTEISGTVSGEYAGISYSAHLEAIY